MKKRILVTGGAGFLGSNLCERLLEEGNNIVCVDNLVTGSEGNIIHLFDNPHFEFIRHDINNPLYVGVDQIYNLACPASPIHYQCDPIKTIKTCVLGGINMLDLAKKVNAQILQASTSEVYGNPQVHPQPEAYEGYVNMIGPRSCYAEGKRIAETLFFNYRKMYNVDTKIVRIFNTYGPKMHPDDGRVVSNFIIQALKNKDITVYGDGNQTRSFCYVDDLVEGIIRVMNTKHEFSGPVNIGNSEEISVLQLAHLIIQLTNSKSKIVFRSLPPDDPVQRRPNIDLAKRELEWKPKLDLLEGLQRTINYFEEKCLSNQKQQNLQLFLPRLYSRVFND